MMNSLEALLQQVGLSTSSFPPGSRYYGIGQAEFRTPSGETIVYLRRRIIPEAVPTDTTREYSVSEGDRLDNIASAQIGDPEQFWQIADLNNSPKPEELTNEPGNILLLP
jgi:hypothetical protein